MVPDPRFLSRNPFPDAPRARGPEAPRGWQHATGSLSLEKPCILGIVNVTPDSFSDGGQFASVDDAVRFGIRLIDEGADVLDVGGESTRPHGAMPVDAGEELRRVVPVIAALHRERPAVPISVDTVKGAVADAALAAGASIVNDVSAFRLDPTMARVCAERSAGVVLMHSRGGVSDMATFAHASYGNDVVGEVMRELGERVALATERGVEPGRIVVDPGIGFAKRPDHSLAVIAQLGRIAALGYPVLIGASRKRFVGEITGVSEPAARVAGTIGAHVVALERGARLFRVHDVRPHREALDVAWAIAARGPAAVDRDSS
jgi:dihydropteroate synthase